MVWENLADPIITGRCEIGHPKLYAEIAEPRRYNGAQICAAGWMGFRFLELEVVAVAGMRIRCGLPRLRTER